MITVRQPTSFGYPPDIIGNDQSYSMFCLERLLRLAPGGGYTGELATGYEIAPDQSSITLQLREGVKFHDGTPFNAEAVKFNLDRTKEFGSTGMLKSVASIDVVDDYTIQLNLEYFSNLVLFELSRDYTTVLASPTAILENGEEWAKTHPVGTGPFKFKSYERDVSVKFERWDEYWQEGLPYLDGYEWYYVVEPMTALAMAKAGEVLGQQDVNYLNADKFGDDFVVQKVPQSMHSMYFNIDAPDNIFSDLKVRQALDYAIDRESIVNEVAMGYYYLTYEAVPEVIEGYNPDLELRTYNIAKAKELLAEAGYPDGVEFTLNVMTGWEMDAIAAMQANLAEAGFTMNIEILDRPSILAIFKNGGLPANECIGHYISFTPDTLYTLKRYIPTTSGQYVDMVRPAGLDELFLKTEQTPDLAEKAELIQEIVAELYNNATYTPWWSVSRIFALNKGVHDFVLFPNADNSMMNITRCWLDEELR